MWYDFFRRTECSQKGFAYYMETFEHTGLQDKDCRRHRHCRTLFGDGLWEIANRIQKSKSGLAKEFERQFKDMSFEPNQFWVDSFQGELRNNIARFYNGQIAFSDLVKQCTMYSCDMEIHFYKSGCFHSLPKGILRTIKSVCVAMQKSFPSFNNSYHYEVLEQVEQKLSDPSLYNQVQREVDAYYNRI